MKKIFIGAMSLALIISLTFSNSAFAAGKTLKDRYATLER